MPPQVPASFGEHGRQIIDLVSMEAMAGNKVPEDGRGRRFVAVELTFELQEQPVELGR
jgi:hypothetical protein